MHVEDTGLCNELERKAYRCPWLSEGNGQGAELCAAAQIRTDQLIFDPGDGGSAISLAAHFC